MVYIELYFDFYGIVWLFCYGGIWCSIYFDFGKFGFGDICEGWVVYGEVFIGICVGGGG